ncbi:MAG TPA: translocase, partial [Microbacterium sp.]|nr:translocase [Microbacterium sp.]
AGTAAAAAESATSTKAPPLAAGETPPFDAEAT